MTAIAPAQELTASVVQNRRAVYSDDPAILAEIYQEDSNIAVWQRKLPGSLSKAVNLILEAEPNLQISTSVSPKNAFDNLRRTLGTEHGADALAVDIAELVDMFCCLFELKVTGLRLTALGEAMCPRFHVDKVPCRLVTTYAGSATEWLPHDRLDRSRLGPGSQGEPDDRSGLYANFSDIQQLKTGDVALLKGESWIGNENAGLVHRSPSLQAGKRRLLLTLDFITQ